MVRSYGRSWPCHVKVSYQFFFILLICSLPFEVGFILKFLIHPLSNYRSLGDAVAHTAGVISDPEFTEKELYPSSDRVIVVATDGLWEFVDNE